MPLITDEHPKYRQLSQKLASEIAAGRWSPGQQVPSIRELMSHWSVSLSTVRQALEEVQKLGLLVSEHRKGFFVRPPQGPKQEASDLPTTLAVLTPWIAYPDQPGSPEHHAGLLAGIRSVLQERGFRMLWETYAPQPQQERESMEATLRAGAAGFIVYPSFNSADNGFYHVLRQRRIPVVLVDSPVSGVDLDVVATDNVRGAYEGARALVQAGCRTIAYLGGSLDALTSRQRLTGFRRALSEAGRNLTDDLLRTGAFSSAFGYQASAEMLQARPDVDGICIANEPLAIGIMHLLRERGIRVPEQVKLCSFFEPNPYVEFFAPLILVRQPRERTGEAAAELLLDRLEEVRRGAPVAPSRHVLLAADLVRPGGSGTFPFHPKTAMKAPGNCV